ncbi:hypothetical protein HUU53_02075 [Candidatus Micrarchaeota archaeon]|nr:hypothetical protein [Candidatus Micrarchaeota archaeon]
MNETPYPQKTLKRIHSNALNSEINSETKNNILKILKKDKKIVEADEIRKISIRRSLQGGVVYFIHTMLGHKIVAQSEEQAGIITWQHKLEETIKDRTAKEFALTNEIEKGRKWK